MAVISVRMNREEEGIIKYLASYFDEEKSSVIKKALTDMYEDILDRKEIEKFEAEEHEYFSAEDILKEI